MKFFIPHTSDEAQAEQTLAAIAAFVGACVPATDRRVQRLSYSHNGREFVVEVGKPIPAYYQEGNQDVIAIFEGDPCIICLPFRGVVRGDPILVGANVANSVEYFET